MLKTHTPTPFDHPEFIAYPNHPDLLQAYPISMKPSSTMLIPHGKVIVEGIPFGLSRTSVIIMDQLLSATYYDPKGIETIVKYATKPGLLTNGRVLSVEVRENGFLVKTERNFENYIEETWYQEVRGERTPVAIRRTRDGVLSCFNGIPAIVIHVFSPTCAQRQEFWENGVLQKVRCFVEAGLGYEEKWENGKSFVKINPGYGASESIMKLVNRKISPVQIPAQSSSIESPPPTSTRYANKLIPAEHARKLVDSVESVDFYVEKLNRQIKEAAMRGYSYTQMTVPCYEVRKIIIDLIKDAGYIIHDTDMNGGFIVDFT